MKASLSYLAIMLVVLVSVAVMVKSNSTPTAKTQSALKAKMDERKAMLDSL